MFLTRVNFGTGAVFIKDSEGRYHEYLQQEGLTLRVSVAVTSPYFVGVSLLSGLSEPPRETRIYEMVINFVDRTVRFNGALYRDAHEYTLHTNQYATEMAAFFEAAFRPYLRETALQTRLKRAKAEAAKKCFL